jgi:hypothetical protein
MLREKVYIGAVLVQVRVLDESDLRVEERIKLL